MAIDMLRVGVVLHPPFVDRCVLKTPVVCRYPGISYQIFSFIAELLKVRNITVIVAPGNAYKVKYSNGTWGGLFGMLVRREIDMTASLMMVEDENLELIDYSRTIAMAPSGFVALRNKVRPNSLLSITQPFQWKLWLLVGFTLVTLKLLIWLWSHAHLKSNGRRMLLMTNAILFSFLLTRVYKVNMFGTLVAKVRTTLPFDSIEGFSREYAGGKVKFAVINDEIVNFFNRSTGVPYERIISTLPDNPVLKIPDEREMIQRISMTSNLVYHTTFASFQYKTAQFGGAKQCQLGFIETSQSRLAFGFPHKSPLTRKVSQLLYNRHSAEDWDVYLTTRDNYIRPSRCGLELRKRSRSRKQLDMSHFSSCFLLLFTGAICALITLGTEVIFSRC